MNLKKKSFLVAVLCWSLACQAANPVDPEEWTRVTTEDFQPFQKIQVQCFSTDFRTKDTTLVFEDFLAEGRSRIQTSFAQQLGPDKVPVSLTISSYLSRTDDWSFFSGRPTALTKIQVNEQRPGRNPKLFKWTVSNYDSVDTLLEGATFGLEDDVYAEGASGIYLFLNLRLFQLSITCRTTNI